MERAFIVAPGSKYHEVYKKYLEDTDKQRTIVRTFLKEKGIESNNYILSGSGSVGVPFKECDKKNIRLGILPTSSDLEKFGKTLRKPNKYDVCFFRDNSYITKEIAQICVDTQVIVNLWEPRLGDFFKSVGWNRHRKRYFEYKGIYYATIDGDTLDAEETPEGFAEIKLSELYKVIEEFQEENKKKTVF